uniref:NitT/TauT family transport system permease protein n=1 Tax=Candidatus Kentrum sp. SD TaxID=2126332 RepID=A0A450YK09_9GAMM|nr:MAG: NitT/TauT family transport system permease protein [Candidatus Kentron sp. SD]VFK47782.1 MAG: NitT/TauT family transport system permease protein [Candidatus Kentron sp. SD]
MFAPKFGIRVIIIPALTFFGLILLWEIVDAVFEVKKIIAPAPHEIALAFVTEWRALFKATGITMLESVLGFILGSLVAFMLAILFVYSSTLRIAIYPYAVALKSTPLIAIAPLLILWFGNGLLSKIVMAALVAFFPVLVNAVDGLTSVEKDALSLMRSLSASQWQIFWKIRFPHSLPFIFSSLKIASSLAVVGAVIGEFTGSTSGIGHLINTSSYYLDTDVMFAAILMISSGGIIFFGIVSLAEKRIVFWR